MDTDQLLLEQFVLDHPLEAAQANEKLKDEETAAILELFPIELATILLNKMSSYKAARSLKLLNPELAISMFEKIEVQLGESILRQCEPEFSNTILEGITPKLSTILREKIKHKADTVGSFMNPITFGLRKNQTVEEAIKLVKQEKKGIASIVCVVDDNESLEGIILLQDLLFARSRSEIASIMQTNCPRFKTDTSIESVANHPAWLEFQSIPVVGINGKLVGILNFVNINKNKTDPENELTKQIMETSNSLGELYRIGLSGFLQVINR